MVSSAFLSESELTAYLFNLRRYGIRLGLENIARLLRALGNPQERFASVHIAGTNGKGSTGALLTALLQEAGFRTGLYTSPHLISFRERIQVDGKWIPLTDVVERVQRLRPTIETYHCTFFEVMTALAFDYFAAQNVQVAVVETGLGGRLDATNILKPVLSVITEIDLDHMADLGSTIADIAREKGGIIKTGVPLVTSAHRPEALEVLSGICAEHRSSFHAVARECRFDDVQVGLEGTQFSATTPQKSYATLRLSLLGRHQICNALTAVRAAEVLEEQGFSIPKSAVRAGLKKVRWPGRFDIVAPEPAIVLDIAHNPNGARQLVRTFREIFGSKKAWVLAGVLADKDFETMVAELVPMAVRVLVTAPSNPRALLPRELGIRFSEKGVPVVEVATAAEGLQYFLRNARKSDVLVVTGSNYTVSDALSALQERRLVAEQENSR